MVSGNGTPPGPMRFRVMYKMPRNKKVVQEEYVMPTYHELLSYLKDEGVTPQTVAFMYIHHFPQDNTNSTMEMMAVDNTSIGAGTKGTNVVPFEAAQAKAAERATKPRVRLKAASVEAATPSVVDESTVIHSYLYSAVPA